MTTTAETPSGEDFTQGFRDALNDVLKQIGCVNIAVFGKTGVGKSTVINAIFGAEAAATSIGEPVTKETAYYRHPDGMLGIYDSQGFETGEAGDAVIGKMHQIVTERRGKPVSEQIHAVWYCFRANDRRFENGQATFVRRLHELDLPVLCVMCDDAGGLRPG